MAGAHRTWHYGLVARHWAEFNTANPDELAYFETAIRRFGEPALDLGCGTGRILIPLLKAGLDVDGSDVSADMVDAARARVHELGLKARLNVGPNRELDLDRTYRTIFLCGVLGVGVGRDDDREALRRAHRHLEPGGAVLVDHLLPYSGEDVDWWAHWLPGHRADLPEEWPADGRRRRLGDGDDLELTSRVTRLDPLQQVITMEMRARLWHDGRIAKEELYSIDCCMYFPQEILSMLAEAGFTDLATETYAVTPATGDDTQVVFIGRKASDVTPRGGNRRPAR